MWKQCEATNGTYTFKDLLIAHEILNVQEENERKYQEWMANK